MPLSEMGKALIRDINPASDISAVEQLLEETSQAHSFLIFAGYSPMDIFPNIEATLHRAKLIYTVSRTTTRDRLSIKNRQ